MRLRTALPLLTMSLAIMLAGLGFAHAQEAPQSPTPPRARPPRAPDQAQQEAPTPPAENAAPAGAEGQRGPLREFEAGVEYRPRPPGTRVTFNLEDADLPDLVRLISSLTGHRFILPGKMRSIKASIFAPTQVTAAEAYNAFLSILEVNGMTVVPSGRYLKIVDTQGVEQQPTPVNTGTGPTPSTDRYFTRLHHLEYVAAEDVAGLLARFKSRDANVTAYAPTNLLIITDTGTQIRRMLQIVEAIDVARTGEQIWIEPIHYADATELATKLSEIFGTDQPAGAGGGVPATSAPRPAAQGQPTPGEGGGNAPPAIVGARGGGEMRINKILADERTNSLIILATERAYLRILEMVRQLDVPLEGEGRIHVHYVQNGNAEDIATTLTTLIGGGGAAPAAGGTPAAGGASNAAASRSALFEGEIRVTSHEPTNALVISSSLHDYAALRRVIEQLDAQRRQVFIEAVIMEVSVRRTNTFGISFHGGVPNFPSDGAISLLGFNAQDSINPLANQDSLTSLALGVRGPTIPEAQAIGLSIPAFGLAINALATSGDVNVLSTPHIIAMDNVQAEISVGENIPLQTSGLGSLSSLTSLAGASSATAGLGNLAGLGALGTGSVPRQDVGTTIRITPHINASNDVRMEIEEEISERGVTEGDLQVISINKRKAKTEVMVRDQQTIVIGGMMRDTTVNSQTRIPILGDIPVIGALFRQTRREVSKTNLLLILTPYVIRDPSDLRTIFERKMRERQEFIDRYFVFGDQDYEPPIDYSRTRGFLLEMFREIARLDEEARIEVAARSTPPPAHVPRPPVGDMPPAREEQDMVITPEGISYDNPNPEPRPQPAPAPTPAPTPAPNP